MLSCVVLFVAALQECTAVIYSLNDTEYARIPPLYGLDEYPGCLLADNGTYCLARFDLFADPPNDLIKLIYEYSEYDVMHYNNTYIQRGVCVTKTCKNSIKSNINGTELEGILEGCVNETVWSEYGLQAKLSGVYYCDKHGDEREFETGDWIVAGAFMAVLIVNLIGSSYDVYINRTTTDGGNNILQNFSIFRYWQWLISGEPGDPRLKILKGLHGVRKFKVKTVLMKKGYYTIDDYMKDKKAWISLSCWTWDNYGLLLALTIILMPLPHAMFINGMPFTQNPHDYERPMENSLYQLTLNGLIIIQTFLVMSGFLLVYHLLIHAESHQVTWGLGLKIFIIRWFRLTPAYAAVLAFTATWYRLLGSGPVWNMFITTMARDCNKFWWMHLLYIQNYVPGVNTCLMHTWYSAVEAQLFCVGLVVCVAAARWMRARAAALAVLLALGFALPAVNVWLYDLDALVLLRPEFFRTFVNDTFFYLHIYGHNNLVAYTMGMATGYLVYRLQKKRVDMSKNKWCIHLTWWIIPSIVGMLLTGNFFYLAGDRAPVAVRMAYASLLRGTIGLIAAFGVFICAMRIDHPLRRAFEWPVWVVPSRLSYCVYLLHFNLINVYIASKNSLTLVSTYYMTVVYFSVLGMSFLLALPLFLIIEGPFNGVVKTLFYHQKTRENTIEMI